MLQDLQTTQYAIDVIAVGLSSQSPPARTSYDLACAGVKLDMLVLGDQSW